MAAKPSIYRGAQSPARSTLFRSETVSTPIGTVSYPDIDSVPAVDRLTDVDTLTES